MGILGHDASADQQGRIPGPIRGEPAPLTLERLKELKEMSDAMDSKIEAHTDDDTTVVEPFPVEAQHSIATQVQEVLEAPATPEEKKPDDDRVRKGTRYASEYTGEFQE